MLEHIFLDLDDTLLDFTRAEAIALTKALTEGKEYTDDCAAVEALGFPVRLTEGDGENIKITTPLDIARAELIIREREAGA